MFRFSKSERLGGRIPVSGLFEKGHVISRYPLRLYWIIPEQKTPSAPFARILIAVPRKNFHRAVDRNLIKRRIREAYRLYKPALYESLQKHQVHVHLAIIYSGKEIEPFSVLENKTRMLLDAFLKRNEISS